MCPLSRTVVGQISNLFVLAYIQFRFNVRFSDIHTAALLLLSTHIVGLIVSNHGCRQMDSEPGSMAVLPDIVKAVNARTKATTTSSTPSQPIPVFIDSGFRTGTHVLKALALGAKGVMVGRPPLWGLAAGGEEGAGAVLDIFNRELEFDMKGCGCNTIDEIDSSIFYVPPNL